MKYIDNMTVHRLLQNINWYGKNYTFKRKTTNEYGEKDGSESIVTSFKGLFHSGSDDQIKLTTEDGGTVRSKNTYYLMTAWENAESLHQEDTVEINKNVYVVSGIENLSERNIIGEISLELIV